MTKGAQVMGMIRRSEPSIISRKSGSGRKKAYYKNRKASVFAACMCV